MKLRSKIFALLAIAMPVLFAIFLSISIFKIDRKITNKTLSIDYKNKGNIRIYPHASKTYFVFKSIDYSDIKFERKYSGVITRIFLIPKYLENEKPEAVNIWFDKEYVEQLLLNKTSSHHTIPFFAIQESEERQKSWKYYFDIYCFLKNKYFLVMLSYILLFAFVVSKEIDNKNYLVTSLMLFFAFWILFFFLF